MKATTFTIILAIALALTLTAQASTIEFFGEIVNYDESIGEVEIVDLDGNVWAIYGDGYYVGEKVCVIMDDADTVDITDDVIFACEWYGDFPAQ